MANLVIDIGNTRTKIAVFHGREIIKTEILDQLTTATLAGYLIKEDITASIISSVDEDITELENVLSKTNYIRFSVQAYSAIHNHYKTPETLGLDRLAGVIGAWVLFPNSNSLVIDAGTCITYDAIDTSGNYYGGSISPGLTMRLKALHTFTGRLPLVELDNVYSIQTGSDTQTSILSGVMQGTVLEITGFIELYKTKHPDLQVILCGGDADFFDTRLKNSIFAPIIKREPNLVLIGLNEVIHQHND